RLPPGTPGAAGGYGRCIGGRWDPCTAVPVGPAVQYTPPALKAERTQGQPPRRSGGLAGAGGVGEDLHAAGRHTRARVPADPDVADREHLGVLNEAASDMVVGNVDAGGAPGEGGEPRREFQAQPALG